MVKVSVVVPHYEDMPALNRCLEALSQQSYPAEDFEIVVADNNSPSGRERVAQAVAGRARLVVVTEKGAGPARNGGVKAAAGEILAFTDSDCVPVRDWLKEGVAALAGSDIVGGYVSVLTEEGPLNPTEAFEAVFAFDNESYIRRKGFTGSGNLFVRKATFDQVGGFRPAVSEDVEWSHRASAMGFTISYCAKAEVGHPPRSSWRDLKAKWRRVNSETYLLLLTRPAGRLKWLLRTWAMPFSALAHTPKLLFSDRLRGLSEKLGALTILYRVRLWRFLDGHKLLLGLPR